ncbi:MULTISPECIES: 3'-5' exonuclease [unclassified Pseudomonas]|uniref:3'-5' exonuclease n=1 Tax=unclassified Pseudomonas TaxID=196821 RepID=UPI002B2318F8|nr:MULTISPECIES: 3'-5' exonuclease [unclassified Pseudomonas]MEA9979691.1 3'-5' exonuclease [Pseudomonas sp. RTS4]MEB0196459.1 3'-5' exonuclease [Pseudomonas sp. 5S4]MEB0247558.1 3'-5' exonuclease [Pseudomonas sp. 10S5]
MKTLPNTQQLHAFETFISAFDFMLCVDLEATCDELMESETPRALIVRPDEMETIEIGLAVVDLRTLETVEMFQRYVRPVLHPTLTAFCTSLTSIKQADVDAAQAFSEVAMEVTALLQKYPSALWGSWGHYDADQLAADVLRANCTPVLPGIEYLDLERRYCEIFACPSIGLRPAVEALGLAWSGRYHRGIDDARNLANMVTLLLEKARCIS